MSFLATCLWLAVSAAAPPAWQFADGLTGWTVDGDVSAVATGPAGLHVTVGEGPARLVGPLVEIDPEALRLVELILARSDGGDGRCYWADSTEGPFGGFLPERVVNFRVRRSNGPQTIRLVPPWSGLAQVVRLRFNLPTRGEHVVEAVRVLPLAATAGGAKAWTFDDLAGWEPAGDVAGLRAEGGFLRCRATGDEPELTCGKVTHTATPGDWAVLRLSTTAGVMSVIQWTALNAGQGEAWFDLRADGRPHCYNVELGAGAWRGPIVGLGLRLVGAAGAEIAVDNLQLATQPGGEADPELFGLLPAPGLIRLGRGGSVRCSLRNTGGEPVRDAVVRLEGPGLVGEPVRRVPEVRFGRLPIELSWPVAPVHDGPTTWTARLTWPGGEEAVAATIPVLSPVTVPRGVMPEPRPLATPYLIGAYYMPGWTETNRWSRYSLHDYPARTPALGRYDERLPEVADWHVRLAVEHGVNVMLYDWFWEAGRVEMEGALQAYLAAPHRSLMRFALLWANHFDHRRPYDETFLATVGEWADRFFSQPEHLRIDGRPVVFIFAPRNLAAGLAHPVAEVLAAARERVRAKGLGGVWFVACGVHSPAEAEAARQDGYDGVSAYAYAGLAGGAGRPIYPYPDLLSGYRDLWDKLAGPLPYLLPVMPGWDNRPQGNHSVVTGESPAAFERMCRAAKERLDAQPAGQPRMVVVKAWNEFPENSQLEPTCGAGFGNLDAVGRVFGGLGADHLDLLPEDVGLGPYTVDLPLDRDRWAFTPAAGWQGWFPGTTRPEEATLTETGLRLHSAGGRLRLGGPPVELEASRYAALAVRLRPTHLGRVSVRWLNCHSTGPHQTLGYNAVAATVEAGNEWTELVLPLAEHPRWRLGIRWLELTLECPAPVEGELAEVRLLAK